MLRTEKVRVHATESGLGQMARHAMACRYLTPMVIGQKGLLGGNPYDDVIIELIELPMRLTPWVTAAELRIESLAGEPVPTGGELFYARYDPTDSLLVVGLFLSDDFYSSFFDLFNLTEE